MSFLAGKLALVTGGSGTIGQAIAKRLAQNGASVMLTGRRLDRLQQAAENIENDLAKEGMASSELSVRCLPCDVTNESAVVDLFQKIEDDTGRHSIDLLVNNAGVNVAGATVDLTLEQFAHVMDVNVNGPFLCSREVVKRMIADKNPGRIINIGSIIANSPRPDSAPYAASKHALVGLSKCLSLDGRPHGISVGIIHPGNILSDLLSPEVFKERDWEGFLDPDEIGKSVLLMASMPPSATVLEMTVIPTSQPLVGRG